MSYLFLLAATAWCGGVTMTLFAIELVRNPTGLYSAMFASSSLALGVATLYMIQALG